MAAITTGVVGAGVGAADAGAAGLGGCWAQSITVPVARNEQTKTNFVLIIFITALTMPDYRRMKS